MPLGAVQLEMGAWMLSTVVVAGRTSCVWEGKLLAPNWLGGSNGGLTARGGGWPVGSAPLLRTGCPMPYVAAGIEMDSGRCCGEVRGAGSWGPG